MNTSFLRDLFSQPTSPFRESLVVARVRKELDGAKVPYFLDAIGNIVVGTQSEKEYLKLLRTPSKEPLRVVIAHLDHPGFHGVEWLAADRLKIKWHGGSPISHLEGASVWIADASGFLDLKGKMTQVTMMATGRPAIVHAQITFHGTDARSRFSDAKRLFGGFGFRAPVWEEGSLLYTKAADDLGGVFAIVSTAIDIWTDKKQRKERASFIGLLTRAEEVGFIGAIAHFNQGILQKAKRPVLAVSLETSRALPGAEIGKGPVVRLGDRATVFDAGALRVLTEVATKVLPGKHQRRIMDGGTCEATAATAFGLKAIGISIPLGNYHNQSFEGGPDSAGPDGPAPEFIDKGDIEGMIALCKGLLAPGLAWADPWKTRVAEFRKMLMDYRPLLKEPK